MVRRAHRAAAGAGAAHGPALLPVLNYEHAPSAFARLTGAGRHAPPFRRDGGRGRPGTGNTAPADSLALEAAIFVAAPAAGHPPRPCATSSATHPSPLSPTAP